MSGIFQTLLYQPLFNIFVGLYNIIPDIGAVILIVTVLVKVVLYPLTTSSIKAQKSLSEVQPKLDALKKEHKDNQQMLAQETMKLYKDHKVNPFGSCLPLLIQIPIFLALYWVLQRGLTSDNFDSLYPFITNPGHINTVTLGLFDLKNPIPLLAVLAGAAQFWQSKMMMKKTPKKEPGESKEPDMATMMNKQMLYIFPVMTVFIGLKLPGGLSLYWFVSTLLTALQQELILKRGNKNEPPKSGKINTDIIEGKIVE